MSRRFAVRIGASYVWGLANFTAGVIAGCGLTGFMAGTGLLR